jgi:hypothetical protein
MVTRVLKQCLSCLGIEQRRTNMKRTSGVEVDAEAPARCSSAECVEGSLFAVSVKESAMYNEAVEQEPNVTGSLPSSEANDEKSFTTPDLPTAFMSWIKLTFDPGRVRRAYLFRKKDSKVLANFCADPDRDDVIMNEPIGSVYVASAAYAANAILSVLCPSHNGVVQTVPLPEGPLSNDHFGHRVWSITGARGFQLSVYHLHRAPDYCILIIERGSPSSTLAEHWLCRRRVMHSHLEIIEQAINTRFASCSL